MYWHRGTILKSYISLFIIVLLVMDGFSQACEVKKRLRQEALTNSRCWRNPTVSGTKATSTALGFPTGILAFCTMAPLESFFGEVLPAANFSLCTAPDFDLPCWEQSHSQNIQKGEYWESDNTISEQRLFVRSVDICSLANELSWILVYQMSWLLWSLKPWVGKMFES